MREHEFSASIDTKEKAVGSLPEEADLEYIKSNEKLPNNYDISPLASRKFEIVATEPG